MHIRSLGVANVTTQNNNNYWCTFALTRRGRRLTAGPRYAVQVAHQGGACVGQLLLYFPAPLFENLMYSCDNSARGKYVPNLPRWFVAGIVKPIHFAWASLMQWISLQWTQKHSCHCLACKDACIYMGMAYASAHDDIAWAQYVFLLCSQVNL